jgi:hypothetical protein
MNIKHGGTFKKYAPPSFRGKPESGRLQNSSVSPAGFRAVFFNALLALLAPLVIFTSPAPCRAASSGYEHVSAVIDVRTTFSDGAYDPETLVGMARKRGIGVLCLNDHDTMEMEYGIPPFRNILRKRVELGSLKKSGAEKYLASVREARKNYPDMIVIPGAESAPFYYWSGNPLAGNLTANDHERRILTIGLEKAEDYRTLQALHIASGVSGLMTWPATVAAVLLIFSLFLLPGRGRPRWAGAVIAAGSLLFILNAFFASASLFDPYHGAQGAKPYQRFIDEMNKAGMLTFWNYPETRSGVRKMGPIRVSTPPYPQMLLETTNYTGFAALYGENITVTEPGGLWDKALQEYCMGYRRRPPWGIATADYHEEGESGQKLGDFQTVLLVSERSPQGVLDALGNGRMYARQGEFPRMPRLTEFTIAALEQDNARKAVSGETLFLRGAPRIKISVAGFPPEQTAQLKVRLIRSGELVQIFSGSMPLTIDYVDHFEASGKKVYYRVDVRGYGTIVSNPIFVEFAQ